MLELAKFSEVSVLCIGDVMLDRFVSGSVNRISPEGPVPVMSVVSEKDFPGGAANVARNIAALGARCTLAGVTGADANGATLASILAASPAITAELVESRNRPTTTKMRFIGQNQQILRVDLEDSVPLSSEEEESLLARILPLIAEHDAIVLSDYAKGVLTRRVVSTVIETARRHQRPVVVDPKVADLSLFAGAAILTPNQKEAHAVAGFWPTSDQDAERAAREILTRFDIESILITRAERGMTFLERDGTALHIKAEAREVFDVVGAGDTVVATLAVAMGAGVTKERASRLANTAAGIVVGKKGTATVSAGELDEALARTRRKNAIVLGAQTDAREQLRALVSEWREAGLKIGFTNGCFDILHVGHVRLLQYARQQCDRLIVGLNSDQSVRRLKGPSRPINSEADRAELLEALTFVDAVTLFEEDTPLELIKAVGPDVLVKGADYTVDRIVGADVVMERGGKVLTFEIVAGKSTSAIIERSQVKD
ncbi:bifunctional D-glycero-beta-D-manno-heptose-7-phosphate kinase/D-glycero-beta-D-manno-heptose 1-phosphate adenylyltransferase HldE [Rhizobium sp. C1]|uniref:bifunctional D-glycero-beta-D-manno-heptose-7-phosphate kinase/D-glycero-beta-D-manno-heptose 1-phosphate adenylyltransferase HldE n=1 Tax=Rhizobium sp. C1 TaxID=1349799 RepID=UPI001E3FEB9D|nr:bifunctional D-glycero-beta-D-manno-heptose-7-phosphate kinase/D-glycero-beta-D-manno-heptose 1-phosphate adenylyltransferase HldE [Rhizobium sp. C1]MCD2177291.1 bifunctional D-glycero-beta-D-manno-heptose-7-phosphate kinase/D-glycero-beta-D-manno-heptose 1-phosphate adenylyltransferase HldE [Rhizobium sp. C1]